MPHRPLARLAQGHKPTFVVNRYSPGNTYRIQQELRINTSNGSITNIRRSGTTTEWKNPANVSSSANCFRKTCSACGEYPPFFQDIVHNGQCKVGSASRSGPANNMNSITASVIQSTATSLKVGFSGDPGNDLQFGAPGITWEHQLTIAWSGNTPTWTLNMENDRFPAHQIRIDGASAREDATAGAAAGIDATDSRSLFLRAPVTG